MNYCYLVLSLKIWYEETSSWFLWIKDLTMSSNKGASENPSETRRTSSVRNNFSAWDVWSSFCAGIFPPVVLIPSQEDIWIESLKCIWDEYLLPSSEIDLEVESRSKKTLKQRYKQHELPLYYGNRIGKVDGKQNWEEKQWIRRYTYLWLEENKTSAIGSNLTGYIEYWKSAKRKPWSKILLYFKRSSLEVHFPAK